MKLRELIIERLSEYIIREVDQLSEGVTSFHEYTIGGSDEDQGDWSAAQVMINYRVSTEVERHGSRSWWYRDTMDSLVYELDRML